MACTCRFLPEQKLTKAYATLHLFTKSKRRYTKSISPGTTWRSGGDCQHGCSPASDWCLTSSIASISCWRVSLFWNGKNEQ